MLHCAQLCYTMLHYATLCYTTLHITDPSYSNAVSGNYLWNQSTEQQSSSGAVLRADNIIPGITTHLQWRVMCLQCNTQGHSWTGPEVHIGLLLIVYCSDNSAICVTQLFMKFKSNARSFDILFNIWLFPLFPIFPMFCLSILISLLPILRVLSALSAPVLD